MSTDMMTREPSKMPVIAPPLTVICGALEDAASGVGEEDGMPCRDGIVCCDGKDENADAEYGSVSEGSSVAELGNDTGLVLKDVAGVFGVGDGEGLCQEYHNRE